jgi:formylmethanofuran dehydrogenase subunit E
LDLAARAAVAGGPYQPPHRSDQIELAGSPHSGVQGVSLEELAGLPSDLMKSMETFDALLQKAEVVHGHMCPGQILGVRMALLGLDRLGIQDPTGADRKRFVTYVEIDRCATDAIGMVTGCRLGKRTLKFRDWGKMAATFVDLAAGRGIRVVALEGSRELAQKLCPHLESKKAQQMAAYRELGDAQLFREEWVGVQVDAAEVPGFKSERFLCPRCGEGVNFGRFEEVNGERLCLSCARPQMRYWTSETDE